MASGQACSVPRLVHTLGVCLELIGIEVHLTQIARGVPRTLIVEVFGSNHVVQATGRDGPGPHAVFAKLDDRDKAVAAGPVPLLGIRIGAGTE